MSRVALALVLALSIAGCKKKPPVTDADTNLNNTPPAAQTRAETVEQAVEQIAANFRRVQFAFDSSDLDSQSQQALASNADILKRFPGLAVEVQGHADDRGTTDYNLALGQRRAESVRDHLVRNGVGGTQVRTVSYGEERPLQRGAGESVWSVNRRAEFRVLVPDVAPGVSGTVQ